MLTPGLDIEAASRLEVSDVSCLAQGTCPVRHIGREELVPIHVKRYAGVGGRVSSEAE